MSEHEPKKSNYLPLTFYIASAATDTADAELSAFGEQTAGDMGQVPIPWAGSIVGFSVAAEATVGAGTGDYVVTINGVTAHASVALQLEATTNTQYTAAQYDRGLYTFTQNQRIGAQYTHTATFTAGVTQSIGAVVFLHVEENS